MIWKEIWWSCSLISNSEPYFKSLDSKDFRGNGLLLDYGCLDSDTFISDVNIEFCGLDSMLFDPAVIHCFEDSSMSLVTIDSSKNALVIDSESCEVNLGYCLPKHKIVGSKYHALDNFELCTCNSFDFLLLFLLLNCGMIILIEMVVLFFILMILTRWLMIPIFGISSLIISILLVVWVGLF